MNESQKFDSVLVALFIVAVILLLYLFVWMDEGDVINIPKSEITETSLDLVPPLVGEEVKEEMLFEGEIVAGNTSFLLDAHEEDIQKALLENETVVLYFYAKWCVLCKQEMRDALIPAFGEYTSKKVLGFRINWEDRDAEPFEIELAQNYGVVSQHTKVIIKNGEVLRISSEPWSKEEYLRVINQ